MPIVWKHWPDIG